jgi:hypothetical protein
MRKPRDRTSKHDRRDKAVGTECLARAERAIAAVDARIRRGHRGKPCSALPAAVRARVAPPQVGSGPPPRCPRLPDREVLRPLPQPVGFPSPRGDDVGCVFGDECGVVAQLRRFADIGVTESAAYPLGDNATQAHTVEVLAANRELR